MQDTDDVMTPREYKFYVYILTNKRNSVLYIGMTNDLERRIWQHRNKAVPGFTARYSLTKLVYFEQYEDAIDAIAREKQLKGWLRSKKVALVESQNKTWADLAESWYGKAK